MAVVRTAPASFSELVEQYDHFISVSIHRISKGMVRAEDVPDLKQAVYTRMWETNYLAKYAPEKGSFSNYLFVLIRSVLVNQFSKNTRNPLNMALGVREERSGGSDWSPRGGGRSYRNHTGTHFTLRDGLSKDDRVRRLVLETHKDFEDEAWERRQVVQDLLARMEAHTKTLKDGEDLAQVLRLLYDGHTPGEIARKLGRTTAKVAEMRRRLRASLAEEFSELAG